VTVTARIWGTEEEYWDRGVVSRKVTRRPRGVAERERLSDTGEEMKTEPWLLSPVSSSLSENI